MGSPEATAPLPPRELIIPHEPQQPAPSSRQQQQQQQEEEEEQGRPSVGAAAPTIAEGRAGSSLNRQVFEDNVYAAPGARVIIDQQTLETALGSMNRKGGGRRDECARDGARGRRGERRGYDLRGRWYYA